MRNCLMTALVCAMLAACAGRGQGLPSEHTPAPPPAAGLPATAELDGLREASASRVGQYTIVDQHNLDVLEGELVLSAPGNDYAWVILDLGVLGKGSTFDNISFPDAPDWSTLDPPGEAWVAVADYARGNWRILFTNDAVAGVDFTGLDIEDFSSPSAHAYVAVITLHTSLSLGSFNAVEVDGALANPRFVAAELPNGVSGRFNSVSISTEGIVDVVTLDENELGGALVRGELDPLTLSIDWEVTDLSGLGGALNGLSHFQPRHNSADELVLIAANTGDPHALRYVTETSAGSGSFSPETAVDDGSLALDFSSPQFGYDLDATDEPHLVFVGSSDELVYTFRFVGGWFQTGGGPDDVLFPAIACAGDDISVVFQDNSASNAQLAAATHEQGNLADSWSTIDNNIVPSAWRDSGQFAQVLRSENGWLHVCHAAQPGIGEELDLNYAVDTLGEISADWLNQTADNGLVDFHADAGPSFETGYSCRMVLLSDGRPLIAHYDADGALLLSVAAGPNGGTGEDTGWARLTLDGTPGLESGEYLGIALWSTSSGPLSVDYVVISYEKRNSVSVSTPSAAVLEWLYD